MEKNIEKYKATNYIMNMRKKKLIHRDDVKTGLLEYISTDGTCVLISNISFKDERVLITIWLKDQDEQPIKSFKSSIKRIKEDCKRLEEYAKEADLNYETFPPLLNFLEKTITYAEDKKAVKVRYTPSTQN